MTSFQALAMNSTGLVRPSWARDSRPVTGRTRDRPPPRPERRDMQQRPTACAPPWKQETPETAAAVTEPGWSRSVIRVSYAVGTSVRRRGGASDFAGRWIGCQGCGAGGGGRQRGGGGGTGSSIGTGGAGKGSFGDAGGEDVPAPHSLARTLPQAEPSGQVAPQSCAPPQPSPMTPQ